VTVPIEKAPKSVNLTITMNEYTLPFNFYILTYTAIVRQKIANSFYPKYFIRPKRLYILIYLFCRENMNHDIMFVCNFF
jgi:hypothetical protein